MSTWLHDLDGIGMRRVSLTFTSPSTEREFLLTRADDITRGMSWLAFMGMILGVATFMEGRLVGGTFRSTDGGAAVERCKASLSLGFGLVSFVVLVFFRALHVFPHVTVRAREVVVMLWIIVALICVPIMGRFYLAKLNGYDPYVIYPDVNFSDTSVLLAMNLLITAGHLIPIRWSTLAPSEAISVLTYTMCCVSGNPDSGNGPYNLVLLSALVLVAAIGRRSSEYHERQAFLKVIEEEKLRVQTAFQLSQLKVDEGLASVNEATGERTLSSHAVLCHHTGHDSHSHASTPEVSLSLSESAASSAVQRHARQATKEVGVQADPEVERKDCATETSLVWARGGFECKRCRRPPRPLPAVQQLQERDCKVTRRRHSRRAARSDSDTSDASSGSSRAASTGLPVNPNFALTPLSTKQSALMLLMVQCNILVSRHACCIYHAAVQDMYTVIKIMKSSQCRPGIWETSDCQCPKCFLLSETDEVTQLCDFCAAYASEEPDETPVSV